MACPICSAPDVLRYGRGWLAPRIEIVRMREYTRYCPVSSCPSCHHALEPIETPAAAAAEASRPPVRPRRLHRSGFTLNPTH
jgi:hypothetical protein